MIYEFVFVALFMIALAIRYRRSSEVRQWRTVTIDDLGITVAIENQRAQALWSAFGRIIPRGDGCLVLVGTTRRFLWIPDRAFASREQSEQVRLLLSTHVGRDRAAGHIEVESQPVVYDPLS